VSEKLTIEPTRMTALLTSFSAILQRICAAPSNCKRLSLTLAQLDQQSPIEMQSLVTAVATPAAARNVDDVTRIARRIARELTQADGVAFDFRAGTARFYADEVASLSPKLLPPDIFDGTIAGLADVQCR
jgi:hypothetical protein